MLSLALTLGAKKPIVHCISASDLYRFGCFDYATPFWAPRRFPRGRVASIFSGQLSHVQHMTEWSRLSVVFHQRRPWGCSLITWCPNGPKSWIQLFC